MEENLANYVAEEEFEGPNECIRYMMRLGFSSLLHPFEYSKVLIQIGYEPIPARLGRSIFGHPVLILPNIFKYASHIKKVDGLAGCFRGLTPKLVGNLLSSHYSEKIADKLGLAVVKEDNKKELSDEELEAKFKRDMKRNVVVHIAGVVISQPFHVISIRMMAQFVGKETVYQGIFGSIKEVYRNEGIFGFFSGFIPRLLCDVGCLVIASSATYLASKHFLKQKEERVYFSSFAQFVVASLLYPLHVVSTCMIVSGSGLQAGTLPNMPLYNNWIQCYRMLKINGEHKRGNSLFWRYVRPSKPKRDFYSTPLPEIPKY